MRHIYRPSFAVLLVVFVAGDASAYLDPGAGSYAFQVTAALVLGLFFSVKVFFGNIKKFLLDIFTKGR